MSESCVLDWCLLYDSVAVPKFVDVMWCPFKYSGTKFIKRFGLLWSYKDADCILLLYQVTTPDEVTLNTLCGFDEFSFGQDVSNSNPNELEFADELS